MSSVQADRLHRIVLPTTLSYSKGELNVNGYFRLRSKDHDERPFALSLSKGSVRADRLHRIVCRPL